MFVGDALAILILVPAFIGLVVTTPLVVISVLGEFGNAPCDCEALETELETVDWLGTGEGIRFRTPGVVDPHFREDGFEIEASQLDAGGPEEREILIDRISAQPNTEEVSELWGTEPRWTSFRHGQALLSVRSDGHLTVNGPDDAAALTQEIQDLGDSLGRAVRPSTPLIERLERDGLQFRWFGISALACLAVFIWFMRRAVKAIRRRSRPRLQDSPL